jgi:hypothetical protein
MKKKSSLIVSAHDRLWLEELYKTIQDNKRPSYRVLRAKLYTSLPAEYDPDKIDVRLARYNGEEIMLQGVDLIAPELDVINKANVVVNAIRAIILNNPEKADVDVKEIGKQTDLEEREISLILKLIYPYGSFCNSAGGSQEFPYGFKSFGIGNDRQIFNQYLYFTDIQDLMKHYHDRLDRESFYQRVLEEPVNREPEAGVTLYPIFKSKITSVDKNICFVLMPFGEPWSDEIYAVIKSSIESLGLQCLRGDDLNGQIIIEDIWIKINQAGLIIADVTNKNPNVMYEVGIAHTVGRPTLLLTQHIKEIPFDFTHLRHLEYSNTTSGGPELKKKLRKAIQEIRK